MRRAPIILSATALGLAGTVAFQPHTPTTALTSAAATPAPTSTSAAATTATTARTSVTTATASTAAAKSYTGDAASTQYGDVQVKITVKDGKLTAVTALALTDNDPRSQEISAGAEPALQASALQAQSASFDGVSGATYTSDAYKASLQSALDQAGLTRSATGTN